jgi:hypothetical protein
MSELTLVQALPNHCMQPTRAPAFQAVLGMWLAPADRLEHGEAAPELLDLHFQAA